MRIKKSRSLLVITIFQLFLTAHAQETDTNIALGVRSLSNNESQGTHNIGIGPGTLESNTIGNNNIAIGGGTLNENITGDNNVAIGKNALRINSSDLNIGIGVIALRENTSGGSNLALGASAATKNSTGNYNVALGESALNNNQTGSNNIAVGRGAGQAIVNRSNNIMIGNSGSQNDNGIIRIGTANTQTQTYIAGIHASNVAGGIQVYVTSSGKLGTVNSSAQFKKNIESLNDTTDKLSQLRPVSYIYKDDETNNLQYGLIAEEVANIYPELVEYDEQGLPFTVKYHLLTPLLLKQTQVNESRISYQQNKLDSLQVEIDKLKKQLEVQNTLIEKITAQLKN